MTVTYEVTAMVREDLCDSYEAYMREEHIPDLMQTGNFVSATLSRSDKCRYRVRYEAIDRASLERYLREHARRLREDFADHFPHGIELSREEWEVIDLFYAPNQLESR